MLLSTHVNKQLIVFTNNLKMASENNDAEAIHDLRVALKRVFAIRHLLRISITDYNLSIKPYFKPLRDIFKQTGIIRDHQNLIQNAQNRLSHVDYIEFRRDCNSVIKNTHINLLQCLNHITIEKETRKITKVFGILDLMRSEYIIDSTLNLIIEKEAQINQELNSDNCNFHLIRKLIKEQYYLYSLLKDFYKYDIENTIIIKKKDLGSKLGDWHDLRILHHHWLHTKTTIENENIIKLENESQALLNIIKTLLTEEII